MVSRKRQILTLIFFIGVVFTIPKIASAAVFGFSPNTTKITPLDNFSVQVFANTSGVAVNAVSGVVSFQSNMIEPTSLVVSDTITSWINESPVVGENTISFEGITFDPGFSGSNKLLFTVFFKAKRAGISQIKLTEGSILKNDGFGTNILDGLSTLQIKVAERFPESVLDIEVDEDISNNSDTKKSPAYPVIVDYSSVVASGDKLFVKGIGEPNALTLIEFQLVSRQTVGDKLLELVGKRKHTISDVYIINNSDGTFEYTSNSPAVPGVYSAIPFFIGSGTSSKEPGLGAQLSVLSDTGESTFVGLINMSTMVLPILIIALISAIIYRRRSLIKM